MPGDLSAALTQMLIAERASLIGYADLRLLPASVRQGLPTGVSIAVALNAEVIGGIRQGPNRRYHTEYKRANALLARLGDSVSRVLQDAGFEAVACAPTDAGIDWDSLRTALPHKTVATLAGLGWIGKCALLVTEGYGSAVRLTSVLTDAPLPVGVPTEASRCGDCDVCVRACPGGAPSGRHWHRQGERLTFFDAFACEAAARAAAERAGIDAVICGICIAACPWTTRYIASVDTSISP